MWKALVYEQLETAGLAWRDTFEKGQGKEKKIPDLLYLIRTNVRHLQLAERERTFSVYRIARDEVTIKAQWHRGQEKGRIMLLGSGRVFPQGIACLGWSCLFNSTRQRSTF